MTQALGRGDGRSAPDRRSAGAEAESERRRIGGYWIGRGRSASEDADPVADAILRRAAQDVSSACEVLKAIVETERSFTWEERTSLEDSAARAPCPSAISAGSGTLLHRARPKQAEIRAALRHLRAVLREAEEAVGDLGG
jgi:hypothetical protein